MGFVGNDGNSGRSFFAGSFLVDGSEGSDGRDGKAGRDGAVGIVGTSSFFLNNPMVLFVLFLFYRFIVII